MTEEKPSPGPADPQRPAGGSPPDRIVSVSDCGLELTNVRLVSLVCAVAEVLEGPPEIGKLEPRGSLIAESLIPTGFRAAISWSLECTSAERPQFTLSGKHEVTFSLKQEIRRSDASYYAEINSVILVYPYIRQLVDDLAVKCLGRNMMIRPLDVPAFVKKRIIEKLAQIQAAKEAETQPAKGAERDGQGSS